MTSSNFSPNYAERMSEAREGMIANMEMKSLISRNVLGDAGIGFGKLVLRGPVDGSCVALTAANAAQAADEGNILGITVRERSVRASSPNGFATNDAARIMRKGTIYVQVSEAVGQGDPAAVDPTSNVFGAAGGDNVRVPNAYYDTTTTGAGLAIVRLD